jgi:hypothetical protein
MMHGVRKVRSAWFLFCHIFAVFNPVRRKDNNSHHLYLGAFVKLGKKLLSLYCLSLRMEQLGTL